MMKKSGLFTLLTSCLLIWGGSLTVLSAPTDDFDPENPADPSAINYCRISVSADPAEGAYVSGGGKYIVNNSGQVYISTSERNTEEFTYTFLYWTVNGEKTSYSQNFYYTPVKGKFDFVAHYEKKDVEFNPDNPQDPSSENITRKYYLYLTPNIEGSCTFNMASGTKVEEKKQIYLYVNYQSSFYKFEGWKLNGSIISTEESFYFTMPSGVTTLQACFSEIPFDPESPVDPNSTENNVDNTSRLLMDVHIGTAENNVDKTRVVLNETKTLGYDIGSDSQKMVSTEADFQIYSLDADKTKYAINERPKGDGTVPLGVMLKKSGSACISASRLDCSAMLKDKLLNVTHDLAVGKYTFTADAGTIEDRFVLIVNANKKGDANNDGSVNVTDILATANYILKIPVTNFNAQAADVSGDGVVNVTDIMGIANIILKVNTGSNARKMVQQLDPQ